MVRHLYVHIPFCHRICPYCSFFKHQPGGVNMRRFVDAILAEWRMRRESMEVDCETIYFGGGTPSLFSTPVMERLLAGLRKETGLDRTVEWTMEANPSTFGKEKMQVVRDGGVTRMSLGVQSLDAKILSLLGRDHDAMGARESFDLLRELEFPVVSVDLMFSVPGQSMDSWRETLEGVAFWQPDHVSAYNLTYEEDTPFFTQMAEGVLLPDEDRDAEMFSQAIDVLGTAGLQQYEISNYARPGKESVHNRAYWRGEDYLGLGPGAVSTVEGRRWTNLKDTAGYIDSMLSGRPQDCPREVEEIGDEAFRLERLGLDLRTREGLEEKYLTAESRIVVDELSGEGFARMENGRLVLTRKGLFHVDSIAARLA
ncbi:MAG: radical SAM family heme chaperone HemW [Verrucomicrobiota bacterium]